jgi:hypothetical protein
MRRGAHRVALPTDKHDPDAVRSFMREYLVPALAEEFLKRRNAPGSPPISTIPANHLSDLLLRRAADESRHEHYGATRKT